jgi:hypothetical protein
MVVKKHFAPPSIENYGNGGRVTWVMFKNQDGYLYSFILISTSVFLLSPHTAACHDTEEPHSKILFHKKSLVKTLQSTPLTVNDANSEDRCSSGIKDSDRFDCFPQQTVSEDSCKTRGCCWIPVNSSLEGVPYCFYPAKFRSYRYLNISSTDKGKTAYLEKVVSSPYPGDIELVKIDFNYIDENILQVKVSLIIIMILR